MSEDSSKDLVYEKQISEINKLGNALLCGLISDGIADNKKNIKIGGSLKVLQNLVDVYKNDVNKLRSLRVASCYNVLEMKENSDYEIQIGVAGKLLQKIYNILKSHVRHTESKVISKEEIITLQDQMLLLDSTKAKLQKLPETDNHLKEHLKIIDNIQSHLDRITGILTSTSFKVGKLQSDIITKSSDVIYFSTQS